MNKLLRYLLSITVFAVIFSINSLFAEIDTTKNKDFVLTFLPNYHNNWNDNDTYLSRGDSIYIFIYAEVPTKGKIEFKDRTGRSYVEVFDIPDPNVIYVFKKVARDFALLGYNVSGMISSNTDNEKIKSLSFRVTADFPVQVYGHSQATLTSESFNVLPVESLGNEYLILAYNANTNMNAGQADGRTPSQFAVVALEDSTSVVIKPSVSTFKNGIAQQRITLNYGDVYLVQSSLDDSDPDLSSSIVRSNKPVAVFSGQQRSKVPYNAFGTTVSRDYLVEQMPPLDSWSNEAIVVPFPLPTSYELSATYFDKLRVIAAYDDTDLFVDGVLLTSLNRGQVYESDLRSPMHIKASAPIMAAGYKRSSGLTTQNTSFRGDPLLQIIPTPNQFGESYRFITIQAYENYEKVYTEHYITIIAEPENVLTLRLNGVPISPTLFKAINGSNYRYAQIRVQDGTHSIYGDFPFGLFVCGYGYAVSYGYYCGVVSKRDDYEAPELQSSVDCFEVEGKVTDKHLKSVTSPANQNVNAKVNIDNFNPYVEEANFTAALINKYLDGKFKIVAIDSVGQQTSNDFELAGFTVALVSNIALDDENFVELLVDTAKNGNRKCFDYKLINYGIYPQDVTIAELKKANPEISIDLPTSFSLQPSEEKNFQICFFSDKNSVINDTLFIQNNCAQRAVLAIDLTSTKDEVAPQVSSSGDPCNQFIEIVVTDSLKADLGIKEIKVVESENLNVKISNISDKHSIIYANVIDPFNDSFIKFIATDNEGNISEFEREIPGYTISFDFIEKLDSINMLLDFGRKMIGVQHCDSVRLTNYGKYEIIINNPRLSENIRYSIPPSEIPLVLLPGQSKDMTICFLATKSDIDEIRDTMEVSFNCIDKYIILVGQPDSLIFDGGSKCDIPLLFEVGEIPEGAFVSAIYPNPTQGIVNLDFNNPEAQAVKLYVFDQSGAKVLNFDFGELDSGFYKLPLDVSNLNNGYYNLHIFIGTESFFRKLIIIK